MPQKQLTLSILPETLAICRLEARTPIPDWAINDDSFFSITGTSDELSIVCPQDRVPADLPAERDWRALKVGGPFLFSLTGIMASLTAPLAEAEISVFALSTHDTDYVLVKQQHLEEARELLGTFCAIEE
ncbi:amino acid-binding protein [Candidatus Wirthbacteria bacterium CG2_30_54_11]|uniref:Amino acid-binding protein n=1 Tax=Candidatus Wirthbacteria bacterium CG2_30_54_11 TaxID=1817892 RepID=A0A1J5IKS9_9BACT|nr:MAG: amino acid-binding protein [Candidatus Wirthbacteria bacterium CG2_30_54_11]